MKKIYMLTAVLALLTLSLNAQVLPQFKDKTITGKTEASTSSQNDGMFRAPARYALQDGEYFLGPYNTDDYGTTGYTLNEFNSGIYYSQVDISSVLDRSEFESYIGDEIIGFRFATRSSVNIYGFIVSTEGPNHWVDDIYQFNLNNGSYVSVSGEGWHEYTLNEPVIFQVADSVPSLWIGYSYRAPYGTSDANKTILVNPNSTGHSTYAYDHYDGSFYDVTDFLGGDLAVQLIMKSSIPKTDAPVITYQVTETSVIITATGNGTVNLSAGGQTASGTGSATVTLPRTGDDQTITATATAQEDGKLVSDPATQTIIVPEAGRSPMPTISFINNGDGTYTITAIGTGEVALYINDAEHGGTAGDPIITGQGSVSMTVEEHSQTMTIPVQATNQEEGLLVSHPAEGTYTIPAMTIDNTFQTLDPQPANASTPIDMSKMMFVDRFSVVIPQENNHPTMYDYYLQETQVRQRTSNSVEVPVKHTGSDGLGFYTLTQIDNDTVIGINHNLGLKMDVRNAAIDLPLESDPGIYFYTAQRGTAAYPDQADRKWLGVLQRTSDGNYAETLNPSYDYEAVYPGGQHHIHLDTDTITGDYNSYLTYVPVVWTMGFDRVLYPTDHVHNSYGAPKWKTGVADVAVEAVRAERQIGKLGSTNWMEGSIPCSMYMIDTLTVKGFMPTVNTMPYEPYMFRVFVESRNGKLRGYHKLGDGSEIFDGTHYEGDGNGPQTGPFCIWSEYVKGSDYIGINNNEVTFSRGKISEVDTLDHWIVPDYKNMMFAAEDTLLTELNQFNQEVIKKDELNIFVRFYYIVKGSADDHVPGMMMMRDGGEAPAGYGSESPGASPSPSTAVKEISFTPGNIVSQTYYNAQGMKSDTPFDGINIVVTRYSDGTTRTTKVVR